LRSSKALPQNRGEGCLTIEVNWFLLNSGAGDAAGNMAVDEALLETASQSGRPVLRFYGWTQPAATFGYFQKYSEVEKATLLRPLIRRPTGGGIVPHDVDWTYSFVVPPGHEWYSLAAIESYRRIHAWIQSAFAGLKIEIGLAPCCHKPEIAGACFIGHEKYDLLWHGKKIAGAAQRRNKFGLLIQGSVQPPVPLARKDWERAMAEVGHRDFAVTWIDFPTDENFKARVKSLASEKFSQESYNRKR
jgi:Biotin/lipoate A/B protein ligase family